MYDTWCMMTEKRLPFRDLYREAWFVCRSDNLFVLFRIRQLTDEMHKRNLQEEREAKDLESMVQSVEENLQLMTV